MTVAWYWFLVYSVAMLSVESYGDSDVDVKDSSKTFAFLEG